MPLPARSSVAVSSFDWKMRKCTESDFELHVGRGESRDTVLLTGVYPRGAPVVSSALGTPQRRARVPPLLGQLCARAARLRGAQLKHSATGKTVSEIACLYFSRMTVTWLQTMGSSQPPDHVLTAVSVPAGTGHVTRQELAQQSHKVHFMRKRSLGHVLGIFFACRRSDPAQRHRGGQ